MSAEQLPQPSIYDHRLRRISPAAEMLVADEAKFKLYESFKNEPAVELVRTRGDTQVHYDRVARTAITLRGTHMFQLLTGHSDHFPGVDAASHYLVRTADFASFDVTEWWVYKVKQSQKGKNTQTKMYLSDQPVHELISPPMYVAHMDPLEEGRLRYANLLAEEDEDYNAITYTHDDAHTMLSWGKGTQPHSLRDVTDIDYELLGLNQYIDMHKEADVTAPRVVHASLQNYIGQLLAA